MSAQDVANARKRGEWAKLLFDNNEMVEVINSCFDEDNNATPSGFGRFQAACNRALVGPNAPTGNTKNKFIREMWAAAKAGRKAQVTKPCW